MNVLILGATSAIAHEAARCFARDGATLFLVARNAAKLEIVAVDLKVCGAQRVESYVLDFTEIEKQQEMFEAALNALSNIDMVLIAHGVLSDQRACELSVTETLNSLTVNAISVIALLTIVANYFEQRHKNYTHNDTPRGDHVPVIAVISSVAGDRGRPSNYVYGTAKAALNVFTQGLRARMAKCGVAVVTIKPGFVDTPMTAPYRKNPLYASARVVGQGTYRAMLRGADVVYLPWFWKPVLLLVRAIPERIFKRLSL